MNKIKTGILTATAALLLAAAAALPAYADDSSLGRTPEGVFPMQETDVEMESELISVDLEKGYVDCQFVFRNTGDEKEVFMGFPGKNERDLNELTDEARLTLNNFKAYTNGKEIKVTKEKGIKPAEVNEDFPVYSEWFTFTVPFKAGERITVRNTYSVSFTIDSIGEVFAGYILKTGSFWKGSIGKARVEFKLGGIRPYQVEALTPGGFRFEGNKIVWERQDFEPLYDLGVIYNTFHYGKDFINGLSEADAAKINQKIEIYNKIPKLPAAELLNIYSRALEDGDAVLAQYVSSFIPKEKLPGDNGPALGDIVVTPHGVSYLIECDVKRLYVSDMELAVTHKENGEISVDAKTDTPSIILDLAPGTEYNISFAVRDWMERTWQSSITYKVPGPAKEVAAAELPSNGFKSTPPVTVEENKEENKNVQSGNGWMNTLSWALFGFVLLIGAACTYALLKRRKINK